MSDPIADTAIPNSDTIETPALPVEVETPDVELASPVETPTQLDAVFEKLALIQQHIDDSSKKESQLVTPTISKEEQTAAQRTASLLEDQQLQLVASQKETAKVQQELVDFKQQLIDDRKKVEINTLLDKAGIQPDLKSMIASSLVDKFGYDNSNHLWLSDGNGKLIATKAADYINVNLRQQQPSAFTNEAQGTSRDDNTFKHVSQSDVTTNIGDIDLNDNVAIINHLDDLLANKMSLSSK